MTDTTGRIAGLLAEHRLMATVGLSGGCWECSCGGWSTRYGDKGDHTAHVAAVLAEAGVGFVGEVERERDTLARWKDEAMPVLDGLQELGRALGMPLGVRITGPEAAEAAAAMRERAERAEAALADLRTRVRALADEWETAHGDPPVDPSHISVRHAVRLRALLKEDGEG